MEATERNLSTVWGERLDREMPLAEYPRPQLVRNSYVCLNGRWECAFADAEQLVAPSAYDYEITVPFSPEAPLSGVGRQLQPNERLWYRRSFLLEESFFAHPHTVLHFGAVDERCEVFLNGQSVGTHAGGYLPFEFDVTQYVTVGENVLVVSVRDESDASYHSRGRQRLQSGGIWHTAQSGIWQTVWLENLPENYIRSLRITPDYDGGAVIVEVDTGYADIPVMAIASVGKKLVATAEGSSSETLVLELGQFESWSPEHPFLYDLIVTAGDDRVLSYFGMRKIEVCAGEDGYKRIFLNNSEYFCDGLLDEGYWPDGLYTAPADEALVFDIDTAKREGFNTLRKHMKIEPLRWYYHCDRRGVLVWQDLVCGGGKYSKAVTSLLPVTGMKLRDNDYQKFARSDDRGREEYIRELEATVNLLYNSPSVVLWTAFNEGWGQFDALEAEDRIHELDRTRLIDHASGWYDQGGELRSLHIYSRKLNFHPDTSRPTVLSAFGGYLLGAQGSRPWSGMGGSYRSFDSIKSLREAFGALYGGELEDAKRRGLCAAIYTQLSDVEEECNGIMTYDRRTLKLSRTGGEGDL